LAAVRNQFATDIEAARVDERNSLEAAFDTRLQNALQHQSRTLQVEFDTKLAANLQSKETAMNTSHANDLAAALENALRDQSTTKPAEFDTKLASELHEKEADLEASHAELLTAALEAQRKKLQVQHDADVKQALETQRLEMETKFQHEVEVARARWEKQPAPVNTSSASHVLETSPAGAGSSSMGAVTNAAANAVSTVTNADAAPVTNTAPATTDTAPETRSDTSPQPRSAGKRPAPETSDQASRRRPKRSRVSKSTSEVGAATGASKSTTSNAKDVPTLLRSIFELRGLSDRESTKFLDTKAAAGCRNFDAIFIDIRMVSSKMLERRFQGELILTGNDRRLSFCLRGFVSVGLQWLCPGSCPLVYGRQHPSGVALDEIVGGIRSEKQVRFTQDLAHPIFWTWVFPGCFQVLRVYPACL
jgi:hypothetical protein